MNIRDRIGDLRVRRIAKKHQAQRAKIKRQYGALFDEVSALLFAADPIGVNFEENTDEYDPEAGTIIPRLRSCDGPEAVCTVVFEEFIRWFTAEIAGPREHYLDVSTRIWAAWQRFQSENAALTKRCSGPSTAWFNWPWLPSGGILRWQGRIRSALLPAS